MSTTDELPSLSDAERDELLALYAVTTQDLAFFKSQQWSLVNYALLSFAAVVGIPSFLSDKLPHPMVMTLGGALLFVALLSTVVLWRLHGSITERQARLERVYARLSKTFRDARGEKPKVRATEMALVLLNFIILGLALALWVLFK